MRSRFSTFSVVPVTPRCGKNAKPLVLVGFMASGKTTIGARLAQLLELPFSDTDQQIEREFKKSIVEIFRDAGEPAFRRMERDTILGLLTAQPCVIATGGGAFLDDVTRARLAATARTIWLDPPFESIRARLAGSFERPVALALTDEQLRDLWTERRRCYAGADMHVRISRDDPEAVAREIAERLSRL